MELRSQDKEIGISSKKLGFNSLLNGDSSSKQLSSSPSHLAVERTRDQTLDHHHLPYNHQQLKPLHKPRKGSNPNPYPDPVIVSPIATTSATPPPPSLPNNASGSTFSSSVQYKECLKNHAAATGRQVLDGCGEFMPSGEQGTTESLKCAACDCHRNFHRKEIEGESHYVTNGSYNIRRSSMPPQYPLSHHYHHHHQFLGRLPAGSTGNPSPPTMMLFGGGGFGTVAESSSEDLNNFDQSNYSTGAHASVQQKKHALNKRFRTKFSTDQKEEMMEFAEKLGWRIQKHDEHEVHQFCTQVGVKRQVFKIWMHNNKQAMKKKQ